MKESRFIKLILRRTIQKLSKGTQKAVSSPLPPWDLPYPGTELMSPPPPALQVNSLSPSHQGCPQTWKQTLVPIDSEILAGKPGCKREQGRLAWGQPELWWLLLISQVPWDLTTPEAREVVGSTSFLVAIFCPKPKTQDVGCNTLGSVAGSQRVTRVVSSALKTLVLTEWQQNFTLTGSVPPEWQTHRRTFQSLL